ncbi:hypothetical protein SCHPADRAFT_948341, partial [Schizopora paradoxa]
MPPATDPVASRDPPDGTSAALPDELVQVGILGKIGFAIQKRLGAFVCIPCKEAFPTKHVVRHAKGHFQSNRLPSHLGPASALDADVHSIAVANGICDGLPVAPTTVQASFQGLSVTSCFQCQGCGYIAGALSTRKWHASKNMHAEADCNWKRVQAQQFQKSKPYFEVSGAEKVFGTDTFGVFKDELLRHADLHLRSPSADHNRDITPYLRHTRWHIHLEDYMEDLTEREALLTLIKRPKKDAGGVLGALQALIERYVREFREKAMSMDFKCREPFENYPVVPHQAWDPLQNKSTLEGYTALLCQFTAAALRSVDRAPGSYALPLTDSMRAAGQALLASRGEDVALLHT